MIKNTRIRIKQLHSSDDSSTGTVPTFARQGDAGGDLSALRAFHIGAGETVVVPTGIAFELPEGIVALVCSRSGLAAKSSVAVLNAPGVVDSGYRGEIKVILHNYGTYFYAGEAGDRIAQVMFQEFIAPTFEIVDELGESERGAGGLGSTGQRTSPVVS